jgi:hypothetical protein
VNVTFPVNLIVLVAHDKYVKGRYYVAHLYLVLRFELRIPCAFHISVISFTLRFNRCNNSITGE